MSEFGQPDRKQDFADRIALFLGFLLVIAGMINTMPFFPGLDEFFRNITGDPTIKTSHFSPEWFFPPVFLFMMIVVAFSESAWRDWKVKRPKWAIAGLGLDFLLVAGAILASVGFMIFDERICLLDRISGERARLIAENFGREAEMLALGLSVIAEEPYCQNVLGSSSIWMLAIVITIMFVYAARIWGVPLIMVATALVVFTVVTVLLWRYGVTEAKFLNTKMGADMNGVRDLSTVVIKTQYAFTKSEGFMGRFVDLIIGQIFPYILLGALFGTSAGGTSLIKLAVRYTRRLRGGPAHAAICSSALFGTISGGPVVNVLGTGRLTIPMMLKNGFKPAFAGGVEAAASSGGQIMPPVMGVAAFVMVTLTGVAYSEIIKAAFIPAICYFGAMFMAVMFQARRDGIVAIREVPKDLEMDRQDWINLLIVFGPILLILFLLVGSKDFVGLGPISSLMGGTIETIPYRGAIPELSPVQTFVNWIWPYYGAEGYQRAVDLPGHLQLLRDSTGNAAAAGWWAVILLIPLLFLDPHTRANPRRIIKSTASAGILVSSLFLLFFVIAIIAVFLNESGLTVKLTTSITTLLRDAEYFDVLGFTIHVGGGAYLMLALSTAMGAAILLGMGMPTVPAYVNVALLLGPLLASLGVSFFTAHLFVFYFAVASAITPPVAVAAFAAASLTKADPIRTAFAALRAGIVMFTIPFIFAFYPELLLIEEALLNADQAVSRYLPGYEDGGVSTAAFWWLLVRVTMVIYLLATVMIGFEYKRLTIVQSLIRVALILAILWKLPEIHTPALLIAFAMVGTLWFFNRRKEALIQPAE